MKTYLLHTVFIILLLHPVIGISKADSLWMAWQNQALADSSRIKALIDFSKVYSKTNKDSALVFAQKAYNYAESKQLVKYQALAKTTLAFILNRKGKYDQAIEAYSESIGIYRQIGDGNMLAASLYSIGLNYYSKGTYNLAQDYYNESLLVYEGLENKEGMSDVMNSLGIINIIQNNYEEATDYLNKSIQYREESGSLKELSGPMTNLAILKTRQGDYSGAIELYIRSLSINEELGDDYSLGYTYLNLANLYYNQDDTARYFKNMLRSLEIRRQLEDKRGIMKCQSSLGVVYEKYGFTEKALESFNECLEIAQDIGSKKSKAQALMGIALIEVETGKLKGILENLELGLRLNTELNDQYGICQAKKALGDYFRITGDKTKSMKYLEEALSLAKETDIKLTKEISFSLYELYEELGKNNLAFDTYKAYISARDSLLDKENQREIIRQEYKYSYDKKAIADSISYASHQEIQKTKLEKTKNERRTLFIILLIVVLFFIILFNRVRLINKQKITIENQNSKLSNLNENLELIVEERTQKLVKLNEELNESDERYNYALEASNDGIWDYHILEDKISFSPAIYTMLGYQPYEFPESREEIYKLMHSDELKLEKRKTHQLFITHDKQDFLLDEYRLKGKNGKIIWVQVKGKVVERNNDNKAVRIVGTHTNITADKLKNQEILETVLKTEDAERSRISKDIHDGLQQTLTISSLNFQSLKKQLPKLEPTVKEKFDLGWEYLQKSITESRNVAHSLMPSDIMEFGILTVFENTIHAINNATEQTEYHFSHNLKTERLSNQQIEITLFRILQESFNNINKYAQAYNVYIQLKEYDELYMLTIEDDGKGFDVESIKKEGKGLGFISMQNRLDAINGFIEINSRIGTGTSIIVEINRNRINL